MNKRGDIPVIILVIGVVGICILAILSFSFSLSSRGNALIGPYLIEDVLSISEQISFYEKKGINFQSLIDKKITDLGNQIYIQKNSDGSYLIHEESRNSDELIFEVEYKFVP
ncbi:MAG: hypothetical protein PVJ67_05315 [Candidatus Pacearchaeota archaeon]